MAGKRKGGNFGKPQREGEWGERRGEGQRTARLRREQVWGSEEAWLRYIYHPGPLCSLRLIVIAHAGQDTGAHPCHTSQPSQLNTVSYSSGDPRCANSGNAQCAKDVHGHATTVASAARGTVWDYLKTQKALQRHAPGMSEQSPLLSSVWLLDLDLWPRPIRKQPTAISRNA